MAVSNAGIRQKPGTDRRSFGRHMVLAILSLLQENTCNGSSIVQGIVSSWRAQRHHFLASGSLRTVKEMRVKETAVAPEASITGVLPLKRRRRVQGTRRRQTKNYGGSASTAIRPRGGRYADGTVVVPLGTHEETAKTIQARVL